MKNGIRDSIPLTRSDTCQLYVDLYLDLVTDIANATRVSYKESRRDIEEIRHRVTKEGFSFLTKALPRLGKALDKALAQGTPFQPTGFKTGKRGAPLLFGSLFERVFDSSGLEKPDSDSAAVKALRQLLYFTYKLEIPSSRAQEENLLREFERTDSQLPEEIQETDQLRHARNLITSIFGLFDPYDIQPKHGPGSVATGEKNHEKHVFKRLYKSIEAKYPFTEYFVSGCNHVFDDRAYVENLEVLQDGTAKVVFVPKDSRGPRIISCEPLEYQWIQQGLGNAIRAWLEKHRLTSGHVNFTDQTINRTLALQGSIDQQWVTLDMKEASDRVSVALVKELFRDVPQLLECLMACRTPRTMLPNGRIVHMRKFAPMGSNLCFPVEAVAFFALAVGACISKTPARGSSIKSAHYVYSRMVEDAVSRVYVYGDDIIMRREDYAHALEYLPSVGLLFNVDKCCTAGFFRESCGMDAHKGVCVTPLRLKKLWCHRRVDPVVVTSYIALSNALYVANLRSVAARIRSLVVSVVGHVPDVPVVPTTYDPHTSASLMGETLERSRPSTPSRAFGYGGWHFVNEDSHVRERSRATKVRFNEDLQRLEIRTRQVRSKPIMVDADSWCMVLRRLTSPSERDAPGVFALTGRSTCKPVWIAVPVEYYRGGVSEAVMRHKRS